MSQTVSTLHLARAGGLVPLNTKPLTIMEHIATICAMRELFVGLNAVEAQLEDKAGIDLQQALVLCCISGQKIASTEIARALNMRTPMVSKNLAILEQQALVVRHIGVEDKRRMFFTLSDKGEQTMAILRNLQLAIPTDLQPLFTCVAEREQV